MAIDGRVVFVGLSERLVAAAVALALADGRVEVLVFPWLVHGGHPRRGSAVQPHLPPAERYQSASPEIWRHVLFYNVVKADYRGLHSCEYFHLMGPHDTLFLALHAERAGGGVLIILHAAVT